MDNSETNKKQPERKKNRLKEYDYSLGGMYFITICTLDRRNYFWKENDGCSKTTEAPHFWSDTDKITLSDDGNILDKAINGIALLYQSVYVKEYVIMPNHVHLMLVIQNDEDGRPMVAPTVSRVINQLKGYVSKQIGKSIWQKSFHDHIIRNYDDYREHINYIHTNPALWQNDKYFTDKLY